MRLCVCFCEQDAGDEMRISDWSSDVCSSDLVFTGAYAINSVNDEKIPVWISDYVLMTYGTGAIMAVPAHDERDFAFARAFGLPIRVVIQPEGEETLVGD